jgi:hypothetical protein
MVVGGAVLLVVTGPGRVFRIIGRLVAFWPLLRPLLSALRAPSDGVR